ncbi:threonine/homoserine efflux transporter RhtA [Actinomadura coerulea]|uniref:Threonine/homoserine efflux transporter RhtA n=1 Tax=Actinomadura coerulea TaxID=46159 RepID=A0A7X0FVL8_9ACTN|nr:hypothetical protein [Actinomadura coerulea]MBB6394539.1 threonine/homoserine efflux transporter RhtA [Actinomadura coerulea]GGQ29391.1 hypothetical protein GCM10010187_52700 [Actinomadura coerulea]
MNNKKGRLRVSLAALRARGRSLRSDLRGADGKVLRMAVFANSVGAVNGYLLVAVGVTEHVGPTTAALVMSISGTMVSWYFFRPSLWSRWAIWKQAILLGAALGANGMTFQFVLRWVRLEVVQPLSFLFSAAFTLGGVVYRDIREKTYSTALWPVLAVLGTWILARDTTGGWGGGFFSDSIPRFRVLGQRIPGWIPGFGVLTATAATYAFLQKRMEVLDEGIKAKANTLSGIPSFGILAVGAWTLEGGWDGMTAGRWPYLLLCAAGGIIGALFSGVVLVKAYEQGLLASTNAMLLPLRNLLGTAVGMLVALTAPGPFGLAAISLILIASCGTVSIQNRKSGSA